MSYDVALHYGGGEIDGEKVDMDLSFTGGSMWVFLQSLSERSNIRASYRLPLGTLRVLKKLLDDHLDDYADYETGHNGEVTGKTTNIKDGYSWSWACKQMQDDKRVRRRFWKAGHGSSRCIFSPVGDCARWYPTGTEYSPTRDDMRAMDWELDEEIAVIGPAL